MRFDVISTFPEAFKSYLSASILKRAQERKLISIYLHGLRKWGRGRHRQLDDKPYGGGAGMVLQALPILKAVDAVKSKIKSFTRLSFSKEKFRRASKSKIVILSAKGKQFNQRMAYDWSKRYKCLMLISGRYEGIDERVRQIL
ncbi:MAG: tRNA (guanosine(37)-N1)-methyltransferase TrmD, partial [Patescibacteria group bacterium]